MSSINEIDNIDRIIKLRIVKADNYIYELEDDENNKYTLNLEFLDLCEKIIENDIIYMNSELLNPNYDGYSASYTFGDMNSQYGKSNINTDDVDVIKIVKDDKEIYLKRLYG